MKKNKHIIVIVLVISIVFILITSIVSVRRLLVRNTLPAKYEIMDTFTSEEIYIIGQESENRKAISKAVIIENEEQELERLGLPTYYIEALSEIKTKKIEQEVEYVQYILKSDNDVVNDEELASVLEYIRDELPTTYLAIPYNDLFYKEIMKLQNELEIDNMQLVVMVSSKEEAEALREEEIIIGINIHNKQDINLLDELEKFEEIAIYEYFVEQPVPLNEMMDDIIFLYYKVILEHPNVVMMTSKDISRGYDEKIKDLYRELYSREWLRSESLYEDINTYVKMQLSNEVVNDTVEVIVWDDEDKYSHIGYRLNDEELVQRTRMPYSIEYSSEELTEGLNKISIVGYLRDSEEVERREVYINKTSSDEYRDKYNRIDTTYEIGEEPIYTLPYIPILMYHDFKDEVAEEEKSITVGTELFEAQIVRLLEEGYTPINFLDLDRYIKGEGGLPEKPIIITTDDGYLSNYEIAYPILKKYNVQATYFITTQYVGVDTGLPHFTWEQALEMEQSGLIDIQSHTHSHRRLNMSYEEDIIYQLTRSFGMIERILGERDVKVLAYPEFRHNELTQELAREVGVDMQITNLQKRKDEQSVDSLKRIHVSDETSPDELIETIESLTMK